MSDPTLAAELERRVEALGYELVTLEQAGSRARPILRLAVDRPDSRAGEPGVSTDDCAVVSRALEPWLDAREELSPRYVLEVSSPGVERPLVRRSDWARFAGAEVRVRTRTPVEGRGAALQGELLGLREGEGDGEQVALRMADGDEVQVPLAQVEGGNLVFRWERGQKKTGGSRKGR